MPDPADNVPMGGEPPEGDPFEGEPVEGELVPEEELAAGASPVAEVRPLPLPGEGGSTELDRPRPPSVPTTVAAATGGFLLGVAAFLLVRVLRRPAAARRLARRRGKLAAGRRGVDVQATRSFLVDVHLLKR